MVEWKDSAFPRKMRHLFLVCIFCESLFLSVDEVSKFVSEYDRQLRFLMQRMLEKTVTQGLARQSTQEMNQSLKSQDSQGLGYVHWVLLGNYDEHRHHRRPAAGTSGEDFHYTPPVADSSTDCLPPLEWQSFMSNDGPCSPDTPFLTPSFGGGLALKAGTPRLFPSSSALISA